MITVLFQRLTLIARPPQKMTSGAAGFDISCGEEVDISLKPGESHLFKTGIAVAIPPNHEGQLRGRSGLGTKGIVITHGVGTIDSDYRGELCIPLTNRGKVLATISPGERIAQLIVSSLPQIYIKEVHDLPITDRGSNGFGSTG